MRVKKKQTELRMTAHTLAILAAILDDPTRPWYGLELCKEAGLKSGTLYPALARLERAGVLMSKWEDVDPRTAGRPRRRLYELTGAGRAIAEGALSSHLARLRVPRRTRTPRLKPGAQPT